MIFKSDIVDSQWDTWCYYHEGTYYLYYPITERGGGDGFGAASSRDGVHWEDHGSAIPQSDKNVRYLGTGAVWRDPDFGKTGRFICNYSEHREEANDKDDLLPTWRRSSEPRSTQKGFNGALARPSVSSCWSAAACWNCIWTITSRSVGPWNARTRQVLGLASSATSRMARSAI